MARMIAADDVATIVDAKEFKTSAVKGLSVVVEGEEQGVPVNWIYYHLNGNDGRRLTFVFTLEREVMNQFLPADRKLVDGLAFSPRPTARKTAGRSANSRPSAKKPATTSSRR